VQVIKNEFGFNMQKNILLIDDDIDELKIFTDAIKEVPGDFKCVFVSEPEDAMDLLQNFRPDYIFVDFNIPKTNGLEFLSAIKKTKDLREIPVFLYSTSITNEISKMAELLGAAGSIEKTYSIAMLATELKILLTDGAKPNYVMLSGK
jgi:PleD family two-component response regulator